ncbi:MAG: hypothetical protein LBV58_00600 [Acholeplasmatales bacterium]|jgi:hypothetical protein|nr:hypothetical protein [Acholeplasmatales bacterium]
MNKYVEEAIDLITTIEGGRSFLNWLEQTDFLSAPASTLFHNSFDGGLVEHTGNVIKILVSLTEKLNIKWSRKESPYIIGLLHDVCKINVYRRFLRNVKNEDTNQWVKVPSYKFDEDIEAGGYGHGLKSLHIATKKGLVLTEEEELCILHHMGAYNLNQMDQQTLNTASRRFPNILYVQLADQMATIEEDLAEMRKNQNNSY